MKNRRARVLLLALAIPAVIALGAFGYWTLSPFFINVEVHESLNDGITTLSEGAFVGADAVIHHAEGHARIIKTYDGQTLARFEDDFKASNGPDLYVYLVKDGDVKNGFLDLGRLKGNIGSQSYEIPAETDLSQYDNIIIWCKAFSVLFGTAALM